MSGRHNVARFAEEVATPSPKAPLTLADYPPAQADYLRRRGATQGLTTDAQIDAALAEKPAADEARRLDEIADGIRRGGGGLRR